MKDSGDTYIVLNTYTMLRLGILLPIHLKPFRFAFRFSSIQFFQTIGLDHPFVDVRLL